MILPARSLLFRIVLAICGMAGINPTWFLMYYWILLASILLKILAYLFSVYLAFVLRILLKLCTQDMHNFLLTMFHLLCNPNFVSNLACLELFSCPLYRKFPCLYFFLAVVKPLTESLILVNIFLSICIK